MSTQINGSDNFNTNNNASQSELDVVQANLNTDINTVESKLLGVGQTWTNVTASRAAITLYTNTTGKPIEVFINVIHASNGQMGLTVSLNGVVELKSAHEAGSVNDQASLSFIVPDGATYETTLIRSTITHWSELR